MKKNKKIKALPFYLFRRDSAFVFFCGGTIPELVHH
jgi:hypothetical protein